MSDFPIIALRSVELSTPDIETSIAFYTNVWGLEVAARQGDKVFLSASGDDFHVLELKPGRQASYWPRKPARLSHPSSAGLPRGGSLLAGAAMIHGWLAAYLRENSDGHGSSRMAG